MENIKLSFPNLRNIFDIYCEGNEVKVNKQLLLLVNACLTIEYNNCESIIFRDIEEENKKDSFMLFREFVIEFMIFHEISHLKKEHFNIKESSLIFIELDADKFATDIIFKKYFTIINYCGVNKYSYLIEKFLYFLFEILYIFYNINGKSDFNFNVTILERIYTITTSCMVVKHQHKEVISMAFEEIDKIVETCIDNFINSNKEILKITKSEAESLLESRIEFLAKYKYS